MPDDELRRRDADEGGDHQRLVDAAAAPDRGEDAHGQADGELEEDRRRP